MQGGLRKRSLLCYDMTPTRRMHPITSPLRMVSCHLVLGCDPTLIIVSLLGFFDPLAEMGGQDYLDAINYGQNLSADALDPSFFNESMPTFDSMLDNFVTEQGDLYPTWPARET
jgi:hypothetical protein